MEGTSEKNEEKKKKLQSSSVRRKRLQSRELTDARDRKGEATSAGCRL